MAKKLYVGNLPYSVNDADLEQMFAQVGEVASAKIITDRESGRSKGFGFVEMANDEDASKAVDAINGQEMEGRAIRVDEAQDRPPRSGGGGRGFGGGGGRGFGGGGRGRGRGGRGGGRGGFGRDRF